VDTRRDDYRIEGGRVEERWVGGDHDLGAAHSHPRSDSLRDARRLSMRAPTLQRLSDA
jgi:hypothetical protein